MVSKYKEILIDGAVKWLPIPFERTEYCGCMAGNAVSRVKTSSRKE